MERIAGAAIKWRKKDETEERIVHGINHAYCIDWFSCAELYSSKRDMEFEKQGFITTDGRFVDRSETLYIARCAGQIPSNYDKSLLYSEYVDYSK